MGYGSYYSSGSNSNRISLRKAAAGSRVWTQTAEKFAIEGNKTLTLSSIMVCQAEGGTII
jgi:hypothetical protein